MGADDEQEDPTNAREKSAMNRIDLKVNPSFTTMIMDYQRSPKFKPLTLNLYDETKDLLNHV